MEQRYSLLIAACFSTLFLSSCVNLGLNNSAPQTQVELALLQAPDFQSLQQTKNWTLKVALPGSPQHLDTTLLTSRQIFNGTNITALTPYEGVHWRDTLPVIIQERLIDFLERSHRFAQVLSPALGTPTTHTLQLELKDFQVDYDAQRPTAFVSWRAYLINKEGKLIAARNFENKQIVKIDAMVPVLQGLNQAFQENSDQLLEWLISIP
ncbi:MAG: hypothetical protein GY915_03325 [bacterium]|nr:hypothetical protein [bacterium]